VDQRVVVTRLGTVERRLERSHVTNAVGAALTAHQLFMEEEGIRRRDVLGHLASER
jgi:hypothetical protein